MLLAAMVPNISDICDTSGHNVSEDFCDYYCCYICHYSSLPTKITTVAVESEKQNGKNNTAWNTTSILIIIKIIIKISWDTDKTTRVECSMLPKQDLHLPLTVAFHAH